MSEASPSVFMKLMKQPPVPAKESKKTGRDKKKKRRETSLGCLMILFEILSFYLISYKAFNYSLSRSLCEHD